MSNTDDELDKMLVYSEFQEMTTDDRKKLMELPIKKIDGVVIFETTESEKL